MRWPIYLRGLSGDKGLIPKGKGAARVWQDSEHVCVFLVLPASYLVILLEASKK